MNLSSHWIFSKRLATTSSIPLHFGDKILFLFGNLWPDLSISFMRRPHTPAIMYDTIEYTIASQFQNIREGMHPSYFQMGIITHYLADFFCSAHNQPFGENVQQHYQYEKALQQFIQSSDFPQKDDCFRTDATFCFHLKNLHADFAEKESDCQQDADYIARACCLFYYSAEHLMREISFEQTIPHLTGEFKNI
jgi:hypothetical protein